MADNKIGIGKLHIIEWLRPDDRRTGRELLDEVQPMGIMSQPRVDAELHAVSSRADLVSLLTAIDEEVGATGRVAMLHIETHGNPDGIGPTEEDGIVWPDLMEALIPLNETSGLMLVVLIAACEGGAGMKMLHPARRAACRALLGPDREIYQASTAGFCEAAVHADAVHAASLQTKQPRPRSL